MPQDLDHACQSYASALHVVAMLERTYEADTAELDRATQELRDARADLEEKRLAVLEAAEAAR